MTDRMTRKSRRRGALALCAAAALLAGCAGNGLETGGADASANDLLGDPLVLMGLKADPNRTFIEYNPRSPLVVPSESQLPPPQQRVADLGPQWPDDPDIRAAREYEEQRRAALNEKVSDYEKQTHALSRAELDDWGRRFGRVEDSPRTPSRNRHEPETVASVEEMRAGAIDPNAAAEVPVPERRALTDPPTQYRTPAQTAAYEPEEKKKNWFRRMMGF